MTRHDTLLHWIEEMRALCQPDAVRWCTDDQADRRANLDAMVASRATGPRKVRAPQGRLPGNAWAPRGDGQGNRKQTARRKAGKGEMVG